MGLEAVVLSEVGVVLPEGAEFKFEYGTLFVDGIGLTEEIAEEVKEIVEGITGHEVLVSYLPPTEKEPWPEYAFDITGIPL